MRARSNPAAPPWAKKAERLLDYSGVRQGWAPTTSTDALGCGHYGCVYALPDPGVVLKFTSDPTEVSFIKRAMEIGDWPEGIVEYYAVREVEMTYRKRPIFAIWRESAFSVGLPSSGYGRPKDYEEQSMAHFHKRLQQFKEHAARFKQMIDKKKGAARSAFLAEIDSLEQWAWDHIALEDAEGRSRPEGWGYMYARLESQRGARRAAASLRACRILAEMMANEYLSDLVGGALDFYLDNGILLADVHANNVGQVHRDGYDQWVITDPGHAVELSAS
jgi:hypothetical protein